MPATSGNYLKSLQLAKQLEERAKEATKNKDLAEREFDSLKQFLKRCHEIDADVSDAEKPQQDFEAAMAAKDYQTAIGHLRKAKEAAKAGFIQKTGEVGDSVDELIGLIQSANGDAKAASELLERSKERIVAEDLEGAMKLAKNAYDVAERTLHESLATLFSQAQETIMQAKDSGDDVSIFEDELTRAKAALEDQEYAECMRQVKEVLESAGEDLKAQVNASVSRAEELASAGEDLGADFTRVKSHIERAKSALGDLKFKEALSYGKKAEIDGETAISTRFQDLVRDTRENIKKMTKAKEDVTIPQQLLDEAQSAFKEKKYIEALHALNTAHEKVHKAEFETVLQVIARARDRFVLANKVGVDMTKPIMLLNTARDNLKLGKFEEAIDYAERSRQEVDQSLEMFYKARDQIVELAKAVKFTTDLGADSNALKDILTEARKRFEAREYEETSDTTQKGLAECKKISYDRVMVVIDSSDESVKLCKKLGADATEAERTLQKALDSLAKEDMLEAVANAKDSQEAAHAALTRFMSDKLQSLDQFVKGYNGEADLYGVGEDLTNARQQIAQFQFEDASASLLAATKRIESIGQGECDRLITAAGERIKAVASMGVDVADLEILLTRAQDSLEKRVFEEATARAREVLEHADGLMTRAIQAEFSSMKDILDEAKTVGIDTDESKSKLKDARSLIDSSMLADAYVIIKDTKSALTQKIARYDGIKAKIEKAEELLSEAGRVRAEVASASKKLELAKRAFGDGDLDETERQLDSCMQEAEKNLGMYLAAKFILASKESIELAQSHGIKTEDASTLLAKAKDLMKQKKYDEALTTAKETDAEVRKVLSSSVSEMIKDLQRLLTDARNVGVDTTNPDKLAEKAAALFKTGSYLEALRCIASAEEDINQVKNLSSQAAVEIRAARNSLKDADTLDMDVGRAREYLDQAIEALTRHQYAIALELAHKSAEQSSEITKNRVWDTLTNFKDRLDKYASEGVPLGMADNFVTDGLRAFKEGRYQDSLKLAMKTEAEMERAELQRDITTRAVELARRKLNEANTEGIKSEKLDGTVARAEKLLAEGKYVDAMSAAVESGDELHSIRENLDTLRVELSMAKERIERLRKVNADTHEPDALLELAQEFLSTQQFDKCRDAIKRASDRSGANFETSITQIMDQNRQIIDKAKAMGINVRQCEDLLEVANTSFNENLWDFAYQQATQCRDGCLELIAKKLTNLIEEIQGRISALRRYGASVSSIEGLVDEAQHAGAEGDIQLAFQKFMEADQKISGIEGQHKKYLDISIAAESTIENLGRYGLSKREPERLIAMAEIEREKDYDSAIELVAAALDTAKDLMESYSPDLAASVLGTGLQEAIEGEIEISVRNTGKALAKDVTAEVSGDFEVKRASTIQSLKPGAEDVIHVRVVPSTSGGVPIKVHLTTRRAFDGRTVTLDLEETLNVFGAGPPYKIGHAADMTRCISCQGRIKPGFDILTCRCGGQLHLSCAKRGNECPVCGQKYEV